MNDHQFHEKVMYKLGSIEAQNKAMKEKMDSLCDSVVDNKKRINKHDNLISKVIGYIAGIGVLFGIIGSVLFAYFKSKFLE